MATTLTPSARVISGPTVEGEARRARPVLWWAGFGAVCGLLAIYVFGSWILSADFTRTPVGPTPLPGWMKISLRFQEIAFPVATVGMLYWLVVRKWRRDHELNLDSMLAVAFIGLYWQDVLYNYSALHFTYNSGFINMGSWTMHIPGWIAPHSNKFAEPFLMAGGAYNSALLGVVMLCCWFMRRFKAKHPDLGVVGTISAMFVFMFFADFIVESAWVHSGAYAFGGAVKGWTLFYGKWYQFPVYESILWGACWTGMAALRYYVDDKGRTVVERGVDRLRIGSKSKFALRFLAVYGALNMIMIVTYDIPQQWFNLHSSPWPKSIQERSYFTQGICGPGTDYECFNTNIPMQGRNSSHVSPDNKLVVPEGTAVPKPVEFTTDPQISPF